MTRKYRIAVVPGDGIGWEIIPVGGTKPVKINVRLIAATNADLEREVAEGRFRTDLFYRLNVIPIHLPPLRERPEDIPLLVDHFIRTIRMRSGKRIQGVTEQAMEILIAAPWLGNIRELMNALEYAFVVCHEELISPHHLPPLKAEVPRLPYRRQENVPDRARKEELIRILRDTGGNRQEAARLLGISRVTLWKRLKRHDIRIEPRIRSEAIDP